MTLGNRGKKAEDREEGADTLADQKYSKRNFKSFVWHAVFLALTKNFAEINTVIPTMLIQAGGTPFHLGLLTTVMVGGSKFMQIFFAAFLTHKEKTKKYLLLGIYLRVGALLILGYLLCFAGSMEGKYVIAIILFLMTLFSFAGAFAGIAVIPFLIALAKKNFGLTGTTVGNYLLLQVAGVIIATILFKFMAKGQGYSGILMIHIFSGALLPITALLLQNNPDLFMLLFPLSGFVLASKEIAVPGILLEISDDNNRAIYTGISGAGSIATIIFPIAAGALITVVGFTPVFIFASLIILSSFIFAAKIHCTGFGGV